MLISSDGQEEFMFDRINSTGTQTTTVNAIARISANPTNDVSLSHAT